MRKLRSPFTTRHTPANHSMCFLNSGESGVMVCKVVNEYGIPNWRRLLQADIFPQKLSRRCVIAILPGVSGVACTSTGTFNLESRSVSATARSSPKFGSVMMTPSIKSAVETYEEAKRCAELFKSKADLIDGVIITLPNFGDERAVADTLRLSRLNVPVLVQATPDTPSKMAITHRRDSFCGKMSACNNLRQFGIPYSLTTLHTMTPDSPEFKKDMEWFAGVCRVVKGLRNLRVGAIGARPTAFNTVRYSEKLLEASGISVETLDLSEVLGRISRIKDTDDVVLQKLSAIQKYVTTAGIPQVALLKMAKLGAIVGKIRGYTG